MAPPSDILAQIHDDDIKLVDLRMTDLLGRLRHVTLDASGVDREILEHGILMDGSALPGWRDITMADLLLEPDLATCHADPFAAQPTLALTCNSAEPATGFGYERDPRSIAKRAASYLQTKGLADTVLIGIEVHFYLFDDTRIEIGPTKVASSVTAHEHHIEGGEAFRTGNPGHRPPARAAYMIQSPADHMADMRSEMVTILRELGFERLRHEHGLGPNQGRITCAPEPLLESADRLQLLKYTVQQVAASYGKSATFMPKPLAGQRGNSLRVHLSLRTDKHYHFAGNGYADLSPSCLNFIAGIITHAQALNALTNPTTNSYRRLMAGQDEPVVLSYGAHNRSAAIRIPYAAHPRHKRIEIRFPDAAANPYLTYAALLMAGLDGVNKKLDPGDAMDRNLYDIMPEDLADLPNCARNLDEALTALANDQEFLLEGDVMTPDMIESYIRLRREELDRLATTPHPLEFEMYYSS
ncbi:MAG: type I glutamate--ammonia ligase [Pseudomonadota bacterium]